MHACMHTGLSFEGGGNNKYFIMQIIIKVIYM